MKRLFRVSLAVALAATSLQAFVPVPLAAQPPEPGFVIDPPNHVATGRYVLIPSPFVEIESIDVAARIITLREFKFGLDQKPLPAETMRVPLAADAKIIRLETTLRASELRIGDMVTLLGQRMPTRNGPKLFAPGGGVNQQLLTPNLLRIAQGNLRTASRVENFGVIAVAPQLILRRGGVPLDPNHDAGLKDTPFSNGNGKVVGTFSLAKAQDGTGTVTTLLLTDTKNLEFNRITPVELREIAPLLAARKIHNKAELSTPAEGKREVTLMVVSDVR